MYVPLSDVPRDDRPLPVVSREGGPLPDSVLAMGERLRSAGVTALLAEHDGTAVGYALAQTVHRIATPLTAARSTLVVDELGVAPSARRLGVGRALMDELDVLARELGLSRVELDVRAWNDAAARFYAAIGFTPVSARLGRSVRR